MVQFLLRPGNVAEGKELPTLLAGVPLNDTRELLGDKAYDSNAVRALLASLDIAATIPSKANRKEPIWFDQGSYQGRHLVENAFRARKQFRGIACRYAKLADGTVTFCWGKVSQQPCPVSQFYAPGIAPQHFGTRLYPTAYFSTQSRVIFSRPAQVIPFPLIAADRNRALLRL